MSRVPAPHAPIADSQPPYLYTAQLPERIRAAKGTGSVPVWTDTLWTIGKHPTSSATRRDPATSGQALSRLDGRRLPASCRAVLFYSPPGWLPPKANAVALCHDLPWGSISYYSRYGFHRAPPQRRHVGCDSTCQRPLAGWSGTGVDLKLCACLLASQP